MTAPDDPDPYRQLTFPHLVKWVEMATRSRVERAMRGHSLSSSQLFALALLHERGQATAAELARLMHLTPQAMTTLLRPLRDDGLIDRQADAAHGRRLHLALSERGRALLLGMRALGPSIENELLGDFTPDERETLKRLLARIAYRFG